MPAHEVLLSKTARKQLMLLPLAVHNSIIEDIAALSNTPRPFGCKKLKGYKNSYRIRIDNYRVIYEIEDNVLRILVITIRHRKDVYK